MPKTGCEEGRTELEAFGGALMSSSPDCVEVLDPAGHLLMINEAGRRLLELDGIDAPYGKEWPLLWPDNVRSRIDEAVARARRGHKVRFSEWCRTAKGKLKYWDVTVSPVWGKEDRVERLLAVSHDITDSKLLEEALSSGARRNAFLAEAAGQLLQVEDPQTVVDDLCRKAMTVLDCEFFFNFLFDESTRGLRLDAFAGLTEQEGRRFENLDYTTAIRGCAVRNCECDNACTARELRDRLVEAYGLRAYCCHPLVARGRVIGTLSFGSVTRPSFTDSEIEMMETLSHFVAIAIARSRMEGALRECDRRKDEFIATLAHELRNPLSAISNGFHVIARKGDATIPGLVPIIERQLDHMGRLLDDLLEISRISTGRIAIRKEVVDLANVVEQAVEANEFVLRSKNQKLAVSTPSEPVYVSGDPTRLRQVVANLIDNATKYTAPNGQIDLTVTRNGAEAEVSVRDNGIGIPEDKLDSIFNMFAQIDPLLDGLGIGLNLARRIAEKHGGKLSVRSEGLGRGSQFLLRLPLFVPASEASKAISAEPCLSSFPTDAVLPNCAALDCGNVALGSENG